MWSLAWTVSGLPSTVCIATPLTPPPPSRPKHLDKEAGWGTCALLGRQLNTDMSVQASVLEAACVHTVCASAAASRVVLF